MYKFCGLTSEELQSVEGIGENIAGRIKWVLREEIKSFGRCE
jgi:ERCC4-type nuclease